jgi:hypothetical protein
MEWYIDATYYHSLPEIVYSLSIIRKRIRNYTDRSSKAQTETTLKGTCYHTAFGGLEVQVSGLNNGFNVFCLF